MLVSIISFLYEVMDLDCSPVLHHTCPGGRCLGMQYGASVLKCDPSDRGATPKNPLNSRAGRVQASGEAHLGRDPRCK